MRTRKKNKKHSVLHQQLLLMLLIHRRSLGYRIAKLKKRMKKVTNKKAMFLTFP
jgi:hypothetical protein